MSATIFVEGGGTTRVNSACRKGFGDLLLKCGFQGRMPRIVPSGSRNEAYNDFRNALARASRDDIVMLLVDSEDPVADIDRTWEHLRRRDGWQVPRGAVDEDALLMTTCMETWIVADRNALREHFGHNFQESALPPMDNLEHRNRQDVLIRLERATRNCSAPYAKGPKSFAVLNALNPEMLERWLPSFSRARRILDRRLRR